MNNLGNIMNLYHQMRNNPAQLLSSRFNLPQDIDMSDPNGIIQHLLSTGQISQGQIDNVRNNPMIQMLMNH